MLARYGGFLKRAYFSLHSWKLTWKPKRGPIKTTVPLKWGYMGFHVSLGECIVLEGLCWSPLCLGRPTTEDPHLRPPKGLRIAGPRICRIPKDLKESGKAQAGTNAPSLT